MGSYSIKDLEKLSGIKAHTLRVWESRYGIIKPKRTETKIRYFDDEELRMVLNISFLNHNGYKISRIAKMTEKEIFELVTKISTSSLEVPNQLDSLVMAMINLDENRFNKIVATFTLQYGFENTMNNLVVPFLRRIGILWQTGSVNPAHEHFISSLVRQKLIVAIDGQLDPVSEDAKKYALFLPERELHEISLLFACFQVKKRSNKAIYLGQSLPFSDLKMVNEIYNPDYFLTVISSSPSRQDVLPYLEKLSTTFFDKKILVMGYAVKEFRDQLPKNVCYIDNHEELAVIIDKNNQPLAKKKKLKA